MNRFKIGLVILVSLGVAGCVPNEDVAPSSQYTLPPAVGAEVAQTALSSVIDDGAGIVYIRLDQPSGTRADMDQAMAEIFQKKKLWMVRFPNRRILSLCTTTTGDGNGGYGYTYVTGALMTYEVER